MRRELWRCRSATRMHARDQDVPALQWGRLRPLHDDRESFETLSRPRRPDSRQDTLTRGHRRDRAQTLALRPQKSGEHGWPRMSRGY
jgi:hypothetical protein